MSKLLHYKEYSGSVEFSEEDNCLYGKVLGIRSLLSYEGVCVESLVKDFRDCIDEYLDECQEEGREPEKPFKGSFNVRIDSDLHRKAYEKAVAQGKSLNSFVEEAIRKVAV